MSLLGDAKQDPFCLCSAIQVVYCIGIVMYLYRTLIFMWTALIVRWTPNLMNFISRRTRVTRENLLTLLGTGYMDPSSSFVQWTSENSITPNGMYKQISASDLQDERLRSLDEFPVSFILRHIEGPMKKSFLIIWNWVHGSFFFLTNTRKIQ